MAEQAKRNQAWRRRAEGFIAFAVPDPNADPASIKRRGRIIYGIAVIIIVVAILISAIIGRAHQSDVVRQAITLDHEVIYREMHGQIAILGIPRNDWNAATNDVRHAWVDGEAIHVKGKQRLVIGDERRHLILNVTLKEPAMIPAPPRP